MSTSYDSAGSSAEGLSPLAWIVGIHPDQESAPVHTHKNTVPTGLSPRSPPPLNRAVSPYGTHPLPLLTLPNCQVHFLLGASSDGPRIQWDIRTAPVSVNRPPQYISRRSNGTWWDEPATNPLVPTLTIRVIEYDVVIIVFPTQPSRSFITIMDVLCQVSRAGRNRAGAGLWDHFQPRSGSTGQADGGGTSSESLLFSLGWPHGPNVESGGTGVHSALAERSINRWKWAGLRASSNEREVWNLYLD